MVNKNCLTVNTYQNVTVLNKMIKPLHSHPNFFQKLQNNFTTT
jgi:hypothetical protein